MKTKLLTLLGCSFFATVAMADVSATLSIDLQGPGGHSNGAYGRTNAVHAAARAIMELEKALPAGKYVVTNLNGGNSVNSIASNGRFDVKLTGADAKELDTLKTKAMEAIGRGVAAENQFRGVKAGDVTGGVPAEIRLTVK